VYFDASAVPTRRRRCAPSRGSLNTLVVLIHLLDPKLPPELALLKAGQVVGRACGPRMEPSPLCRESCDPTFFQLHDCIPEGKIKPA